MALFSSTDMDKLSAPHIARAWFAELNLPSGFQRVHNGVGRVTVGGYEWRGVSDPVSGALVSIEAVEDPRFGQAAAVNIVLSGVNATFWKSVKQDARDLEGRSANLYWGAFDQETGENIMFKKLLPGKMSAPSLHRQGIGVRFVGLTIESFWQAQNYPFGGRWNGADQRRRYPGDKGLDLVGVEVAEQWQ
jgi:hypothetical protein